MGISGTIDFFGEQMDQYTKIQTEFKKIASTYGAKHIQTSALDSIELFKRTSGQDADICHKEMFAATNKNNPDSETSIVLKPEGTAPTIRALQEANTQFNQCLTVAYFDRMYRYNRPQKGRLREFTQAGLEFCGLGPLIDFQAIQSACKFLEQCKILEHVTLKINTVGNNESRALYAKKLGEFLTANKDKITEQTYKKAQSNPLRALDKLTDEEKTKLPDLPKIIDNLDEESQEYFQALLQYLDTFCIKYEVDQTIVRGLDYYTHTVFEFVGANSASQGTVLAGGRYDHLIPMLTKQHCSAIGWGSGIERIMFLQQELSIDFTVENPEIFYIISLDTDLECLQLAEKLRGENQAAIVMQNIKLDKALKQINQNNGKWVIICGSEEKANDSWLLKNMETGESTIVKTADIMSCLI